MRPLIAAVLAGVAASAAAAHDVDGAGSASPGWTLDPGVVLPLAVALALFAIGWLRLSMRSTRGLPDHRRRAVAFVAGWSLLAAALMSPLHALGERAFSAHMLEHEIIMLAAAPLLVVARPSVVLLWAFPAAARRWLGRALHARPVASSWRRLTAPITATVLQALALWLWHAPALFDLALASDGWHVAQHLCFLVTALLFWTAVLGRTGSRSRARGARALAALCLFATSVVSGLLGALMAFSQSPWYRGYAELGLSIGGLSPAEDQQLAGLIMWIPGGLVHAVAALVLARTLLAPHRSIGPTIGARDAV